jgi:hypothetical protein
MRGTVSKASSKFSLLLTSLVFGLLTALGGSGTASVGRVEGSFPTLDKNKDQTTAKSEPQKPDDPQVKAVLDKMAAAGVARPETVSDV